MLIDTDILIWAARGYTSAIDALDSIAQPQLSVVTVIELMQGAKNKRELNTLEKRLRTWGAQTLVIDSEISSQATSLIREYALARGLQLADAFIAATAITHGLPLISGNQKHYRDLRGLQYEVFHI